MQPLARTVLRIGGWTAVGEIPKLDKAVFIAAPHTSNWDGFWLLVYKLALGVPVRFFAKHTLFWWPLGTLLRKLGAIPVERTRSGDNVGKLTALFASSPALFLALAPEGTRRWQPYWRTGFYRIADAAQVPIVLAFIDYRTKRLGIGPQLDTRDGVAATLAKLRSFYGSCTPRKPQNMGPIAFPPD
ncbi:MAG TPA: 1-acyl-sn-glycerol-3-phosphate acyltransferase [Woeseiaceae bacterium]|nr:1-acyl-sn-glycerol-3-phosphate acyltransferase [Woeseiaceae bacterium]